MEVRPHCDHQLDARCHRGKRSGSRPGIEGRLLDTLDVVEIELGDEAEIPAGLFAPLSEPFHIVPAFPHSLVGNVPKPTAEDGHPIAEPHAAALPFSMSSRTSISRSW